MRDEYGASIFLEQFSAVVVCLLACVFVLFVASNECILSSLCSLHFDVASNNNKKKR